LNIPPAKAFRGIGSILLRWHLHGHRVRNTVGGGVYTTERYVAEVSTTAVIRVPRPGAVSIASLPPMAERRSVMFVNPIPMVAGSNPRPPISMEDGRAAMVFAMKSALAQWCGLDWKRSFLPMIAFGKNQKKMSDRQLQLMTLIHGDFRLDNMLFSPQPLAPDDEPIAHVLDWQLAARGRQARPR